MPVSSTATVALPGRPAGSQRQQDGGQDFLIQLGKVAANQQGYFAAVHEPKPHVHAAAAGRFHVVHLVGGDGRFSVEIPRFAPSFPVPCNKSPVN